MLWEDESFAMEIHAWALSKHLQETVQTFIREQQGLPVLFQYTADATSLLCMSYECRAHLDAPVTMRKGKALHELLLQRGTFISFEGQTRKVAHLVVPPGSSIQARVLGIILLLHLISQAH